ncbi:MAG: OsmC family protein [Candidatus Hydrothermarchaeales archaeon]
MSIINHVDLDKLGATVEKFKANPELAKKVNKVEGEWILDTMGGPQFRAVIQTESGDVTLEADQPIPLGGSGSAPGPMIYCLYGVASCYLATFASIAAEKGVELKRLQITTEAHMDLSRSMGLSQNPTVEKVVFEVKAESDASDEKIREIEGLAKERCPAVFCLTQPINLEIKSLK